MLKAEIEQVQGMIDHAVKRAVAPLADEIEGLKKALKAKKEPAAPDGGKPEDKK